VPEASIVFERFPSPAAAASLFDLMCANDLEGIVAKRLADRYDTRARWLKIKNPDYSQKEGRGICSTDRGSAQRILQGGGEFVHGSAHDARQRRRGLRAADRVGQGVRPTGRTRSRRAGAAIRRRDHRPRVARAALRAVAATSTRW
jgi:hypothetical protein